MGQQAQPNQSTSTGSSSPDWWDGLLALGGRWLDYKYDDSPGAYQNPPPAQYVPVYHTYPEAILPDESHPREPFLTVDRAMPWALGLVALVAGVWAIKHVAK